MKAPAEQQLIDSEAPFLLRPAADDPDDQRNWVLKAIERTGQSLEDALATWAGGFALENDLLWEALVESRGKSAAPGPYEAVWDALPAEIQQAAHLVLTFTSDQAPYGLKLELGPREIVALTGAAIEDELVFWNKAFVAHDHMMWRVLEREYGAREALIVYSRVWEGFALAFLDPIKKAIGVERPETTDDLAKLNRAFWEAIGSEVEEVETTQDRHVAIIKTCPFWDNMVDQYGKVEASRMHQKTIGATSANYYQAIMKALGLWDEYFVTQDQYRCLGDGQCRMVYVRRSAMAADDPR